MPADLQSAIGTDNLIVFDGVCVLCSGFFSFMYRHDARATFRYSTAQSPLGQVLYTALDLPTDDFETNLVIVDGVIHQRLDAFCMAMAQLALPWRALSILRYLPAVVKDPAYHLIARNRYRIFGRTEVCMLPGPELRGRFVADGF
ncbi:thiol-disulfide oxidoreductase DCC family protein [Roseobacter sp. A03A-229]